MPEDSSAYLAVDYDAFRRGSRRIRLRWEGGQALAVLYDEGVPDTARAVAAALPLTVTVIHAAWSGDMVMSARPYEVGPLEAENDVRLVRPGDLTWDPKFQELAFAYGTAEARIPAGPNTLVVFGSVVQGGADFAAFGRARRFEGAADLVLEAVD